MWPSTTVGCDPNDLPALGTTAITLHFNKTAMAGICTSSNGMEMGT